MEAIFRKCIYLIQKNPILLEIIDQGHALLIHGGQEKMFAYIYFPPIWQTPDKRFERQQIVFPRKLLKRKANIQ